ncbi:histidine kinase N-terminal 7TM domain-containing protein [Halorientalis brevis]|uniref:Histidine kinase N-terminal 7TM domain-containing protein n=1 Tax=Halorientalis brevis TaxID=1126241 RepID=A0ABD6C6L5_9EURY|nr:histidine kinase N-terminal 7TM domain-containing protein [Halorientalis brevis]
MALQYTPYTAPVFLSAVVGLGVALFAFFHRDRTGARPLALFMISASVWSFAEGMNLAHADLAGMVFWTKMELAISGLVPLSFLLLVLEYTGNEEWLRSWSLGALLVEPAMNAAAVWLVPDLVRRGLGVTTINGFRVITETFGPAYYVHIIYSYVTILVAGALLLRVILLAEGLYRAQATALLVAGSVPVLGNVLYTFGLFPAGLDPTNVGFLLTGFLIAATILRRQLLEIVPVARDVARDEILENMDDRVIVTDENDRIADLNPAAAELLDRPEDEAIGQPIDDVLPAVATLLDSATEGRTQTELSLESGDGVRYYDVRVSPLNRARGMVAGRLVSLRDVTEQRQQRQRLDVLNRLLRHNLRNEMNVIAGNAELLEHELTDSDLLERIDQIESTATQITARSDKVGQAARLLDDPERVELNLEATVVEQVEQIRETYPQASVTVDVPSDLDVSVGLAVAVAIHELLVNAIEHNDGQPVVSVVGYPGDQFAVLEISDDGPGIEDHELEVLTEGKETALRHGSGVGLWVVNWVAEQFGGRLAFENDDDGTTVRLQLPRVSDDAGSGPSDAADASESATVDGIVNSQSATPDHRPTD